MIKGSSVRKADHSIDSHFLDRWSPRAMSGEPIERHELLAVLEAARWAPSSYNLQPWRILYAHRDTPDWPLFLNLLIDFNQGWARHAGALLVLISHKLDPQGHPTRTHSFDTGAAWAYLALQGSAKGLVVHGMEGLDYARAQVDLNIPDDYRVEMMVAVGKPGKQDSLPRQLQEREYPSDRRQLAQTAFAGKWPTSAAALPRRL